MAHGDTREGKWRGYWRMEWVASTLHTTSEHGVFSITTTDAHTSATSSRMNWRPRRFKWTRPFRRKTKFWFLRVCHHISNAVYIVWVCVCSLLPGMQSACALLSSVACLAAWYFPALSHEQHDIRRKKKGYWIYIVCVWVSWTLLFLKYFSF